MKKYHHINLLIIRLMMMMMTEYIPLISLVIQMFAG